MAVVALRFRLQGREGFCGSIDPEVAYDLRDALYDEMWHPGPQGGFQSSSQACDFVQHSIEEQDPPPEHSISPEVADDLVRGIDRVAKLPYDLPPALVQLRCYLVVSG